MKTTLAESYIGISIHSSPNNTPSIPPFCTGSKIKARPEEKSDDELTAGIGDFSYFSPFTIYG